MKKMIELHMNDGRVVSIDPEKVTAVLEHSTTGGSALLCDGGHKLIVQEKRAAVVGIITRGGGVDRVHQPLTERVDMATATAAVMALGEILAPAT